MALKIPSQVKWFKTVIAVFLVLGFVNGKLTDKSDSLDQYLEAVSHLFRSFIFYI